MRWLMLRSGPTCFYESCRTSPLNIRDTRGRPAPLGGLGALGGLGGPWFLAGLCFLSGRDQLSGRYQEARLDRAVDGIPEHRVVARGTAGQRLVGERAVRAVGDGGGAREGADAVLGRTVGRPGRPGGDRADVTGLGHPVVGVTEDG